MKHAPVWRLRDDVEALSREARTGADISRAVIGVAAGLGVFLIYMLLIPSNVVENIDGYEYARAVETLPWAHVHDVRAALFHKVNSALFAIWSGSTGAVSGFDFLVAQSMIAAIVALALMFYVLNVGAGLSTAAALTTTGLLGASYGFLRYAVAAELYVPSAALILATVALLMRAEMRYRFQSGLGLGLMIGPGILAGLTTVYYLPNAIPLFLAMPILLLARGRVLRAAAYAVAGGVTILGCLIVLYFARGHATFSFSEFLAFLSDRNDQLLVPSFGLGSLAKALSSVTHMLASTHWLWGFDAFTDWAMRTLPKRYYHMEDVRFAVRAAGGWSALAAGTFGLVVLFGVLAVAVRVVQRSMPRLAPVNGGVFGARVALFFAAWFAIHAIITTRLDPAAEEAWIIALVPLIGLFGLLVVAPLFRRGQGGIVIALLGLVLLHNVVGGIGYFKDARHEYRAVRLGDVAREAKPGDGIIFMGQEFFQRSHAHYRLGLTVIEVQGPEARLFNIDARATERLRTLEAVRRIRGRGHRVFVLEEQMTQRDRIGLREGDAAVRGLQAFNATWQSKLRLVASGPWGRTFEIVD